MKNNFTPTLFLAIGFLVFFLGFHNVDICSNMMIINCEQDLNYHETNFKGDYLSLETCYRTGLIFLIVGLMIVFTSASIIKYE